MANSCVYIPSYGADLFIKLKSMFGYKKARQLFYIAINKDFINDFKSSLKFDKEGVPTYSSLMKNKYIQEQISPSEKKEALQKQFKPIEDTIDNYQSLVDSARTFNETSEFKKDFLALVEQTDDGKLVVSIVENNEANKEAIKNQQASLALNRKLATIFSRVGVTVSNLTEAETQAGRVGVTDFSVAKGIANGFDSIIRVANNMEGANAVSEEFSHLIIGCFQDDVLVKRAINQLANEDILKAILGEEDFQDNLQFHNGDLMLVAEEALGHLLQDHLISQQSKAESTLAKRALNKITQQFKDYNVEDVQKAVLDVDSFISEMAKKVLDGTMQINKELIANSQREVRLNALSKKVERNISILQKALEIELKRSKIQKNKYAEKTESLIQSLAVYTNPDKDAVIGIYNYIESAIKSLQSLNKRYATINDTPLNERFGLLRATKNYLDSYAPFIKMLSDALSEDESTSAESALWRSFEKEGLKTNIKTELRELKTLQIELQEEYWRKAKSAFTDYIKPFLGENAVVTRGERAGQKLTAEDIVNGADFDISLYDTWLNAMSDSGDVLLQVFDSVVKYAKDAARVNTIEDMSQIQALFLDANKNGIKNFDWMFETYSDGSKTGNYISKTNVRQYWKDKKNFEDELDKKYGEYPTGEAARKKKEEKDEWHKIHSADSYIIGSYSPNETYYHNNDFDKLSKQQMDFYERFMDIKHHYDSKLPKGRVFDPFKAIQQRKDSAQRLGDIKMSNAYDELVKHMKSEFGYRKEDDNQEYGASSVDFGGKEYMRLPVLYVDRITPSELSTDLYRNLMSYSIMANTYEQMEEVVNPLEVGRSIVENPNERVVKKEEGGKIIREKISKLGITSITDVTSSGANIVKKLDEFMKAQVYGRYLEDQGCYHFLGKVVDKQKFWGKMVQLSATAQLGFNWIADTVNVLNGTHMQNIEAMANQYFGVKELAEADTSYGNALKDMVLELNKTTKTNKLDLFDQLFDVKQNFKSKITYSNKTSSWLKRIYGKSFEFIGQEAGDHWLYNRTAIAMAMRKKVLLNGKEMSLWDALQVEDSIKGRTDVKKLNHKKIKELDGSDLDISGFSRKVAHVNQRLFGIYNEDDLIAARRYAVGKVTLLFRGWLFPSLNKRFRQATYNNIMDEVDEGYYYTAFRIIRDLRRGDKQFFMLSKQLSDREKSNIRRCFTEMVQTLLVWGLANWVEWPDDKNRPLGIKLCELIARKDAHDLATLTPSLAMLSEARKTLQSPSAVLGPAGDCIQLLSCFITPDAWTHELQTGPYQGWTRMQKAVYNLPIPVVNHVRRYGKIFDSDIVDTSIDWYIRPASR